jgi:hypothetical protein
MKLYVEYIESTRVVKKGEGTWRDGERRECDFKVIRVTTYEPPSAYYEEFEVSDVEIEDAVSVVVVRYSDGDTFSRTTGHGAIVGVYKTLKEARKVEGSIRDDSYDGYQCWKGYFARLEDVEIIDFRIRE